MARYKCIPYYELTRNGKTISFDIDGYYETDNKIQIKLLESCKPFIERVDSPEETKNADAGYTPEHIGGGYYELSNGEKVRGKDEALKAEAEI